LLTPKQRGKIIVLLLALMKKAIIINTAIVAIVAYAFAYKPMQKPEVVTLEQLQKKVLQKDDSTIYIVNFWATWCQPCIKELPYFEEAGKKFAGKKVKVLLVSLDFMSEKERVIKFAEVKKLESEVYQLNAGNPNNWIDKVDNSWSGAIPATAMYQNGEKIFFREGDFTKQELDSLIQTKIN